MPQELEIGRMQEPQGRPVLELPQRGVKPRPKPKSNINVQDMPSPLYDVPTEWRGRMATLQSIMNLPEDVVVKPLVAAGVSDETARGALHTAQVLGTLVGLGLGGAGGEVGAGLTAEREAQAPFVLPKEASVGGGAKTGMFAPKSTGPIRGGLEWFPQQGTRLIGPLEHERPTMPLGKRWLAHGLKVWGADPQTLAERGQNITKEGLAGGWFSRLPWREFGPDFIMARAEDLPPLDFRTGPYPSDPDIEIKPKWIPDKSWRQLVQEKGLTGAKSVMHAPWEKGKRALTAQGGRTVPGKRLFRYTATGQDVDPNELERRLNQELAQRFGGKYPRGVGSQANVGRMKGTFPLTPQDVQGMPSGWANDPQNETIQVKWRRKAPLEVRPGRPPTGTLRTPFPLSRSKTETRKIVSDMRGGFEEEVLTGFFSLNPQDDEATAAITPKQWNEAVEFQPQEAHALWTIYRSKGQEKPDWFPKLDRAIRSAKLQDMVPGVDTRSELWNEVLREIGPRRGKLVFGKTGTGPPVKEWKNINSGK